MLGLLGGYLKIPMSAAHNFQIFTHALYGITSTCILGKDPKYRKVRLNTRAPDNPSVGILLKVL